MKANKVLEWIVLGTSLFFFGILFSPFNGTDLFFTFLFGNYHLVIVYFAPLVACLLVLLKNKIHSVELISMILFITGSIFLIKEIDETLTVNGFVVVDIVLQFIDVVLLLYILNSRNEYSVRDIVESAMLIALAVGLDLPGLKLRIGVNGGSISFTMLPLFILALRLGTLKGFIGCAIVYGSITCLLDADGGGLNAYIFDYFFGYGSIALIGFFRNFILKKGSKLTIMGLIFLVIGVAVSIAGRLTASTISGMVFWDTPFVDSLIYNALYILPSGGFCLAALIVLYKPFLMINTRFPNKTTI